MIYMYRVYLPPRVVGRYIRIIHICIYIYEGAWGKTKQTCKLGFRVGVYKTLNAVTMQGDFADDGRSTIEAKITLINHLEVHLGFPIVYLRDP